MELAIAIQSIKEIELATKPWEKNERQNDIEKELQEVFFKEWLTLFPDKKKVDRLYFGSEFCQYRLAPLSIVKKALLFSRNHDLFFTFATPYVHEEKFKQLAEILSFLNEESQIAKDRIEVVVNDWGVYHFVRRNCPHLSILIGRLLNKTIRDPRIAQFYNKSEAPKEAKNYFKGTGLFSSSFQEFLGEDRLVGIEFDELIQGQIVPDTTELTTAFHYPFGCVASGNACMVGFIDSEKKDKFRGDPKCKQQCQLFLFELKNRFIKDGQQRMFQKGNTAFYVHDEHLIRRGLQDAINSKRSRIVYSPKIPV